MVYEIREVLNGLRTAPVGRLVLICLPLLMLVLAGPVAAERETVDKIAVVVGDDVILASELASQIQLAAFQTGQRPKTQKEIEEFLKGADAT